MFITLSYWARSAVSMPPMARIPALLTRTSSRPKWATVRSTVFFTVSSSVRPPGTSSGCTFATCAVWERGDAIATAENMICSLASHLLMQMTGCEFGGSLLRVLIRMSWSRLVAKLQQTVFTGEETLDLNGLFFLIRLNVSNIHVSTNHRGAIMCISLHPNSHEIKRSTCVHSSNGSKAPSYLCSATFSALSGHFPEVFLVPAVQSQQSAQFGKQDAGTCTDARARTGYQSYFPLEGRHLKHTFKGRCCAAARA